MEVNREKQYLLYSYKTEYEDFEIRCFISTISKNLTIIEWRHQINNDFDAMITGWEAYKEYSIPFNNDFDARITGPHAALSRMVQFLKGIV